MNGGGGGVPLPPGELVQLPGEDAPIVTGWLLRRMLACDLDGHNAGTCWGESNTTARERRIALTVSDVVKDAIPLCPPAELPAAVVPIAAAAATAVFYRTWMQDQPLPPYHPSDPFYYLTDSDIRRYASFRLRVSNERAAAGCSPATPPNPNPSPHPGQQPPPEPPNTEPPATPAQASGMGVGVLFLLGGLALVAASRVKE